MISKQVIFFVFPLMVLLSGCCSSQNTAYFDLGALSYTNSENLGISVSSFSTEQPSSNKMVFRTNPNQIEFDSWNNWAQTPQALLTKYLTFYLNDSEKPLNTKISSEHLSIEGTIFNFECDTKIPEAVLNIKIKILKNNSVILNKFYCFKERMAKLSATDFSDAMSIASLKLAQQIVTDLKTLNTK